MRTILFTALALGLLAAGCTPAEKSSEVGASNAPASAAAAEPVAFRNEKGELFCPVMKSVVASKEEAAGFADHKGKRYYFCCAMCPDKFKADPAAYVPKS